MLLLDWIHRGLTVSAKEQLIAWHKKSLSEFGITVLAPESHTPEGEYGDYFSEEK